jgi:hypothetical protein
MVGERGSRLKLGDSEIQDGPDGKLTRTESGSSPAQFTAGRGWPCRWRDGWRFHVSVTSRAVVVRLGYAMDVFESCWAGSVSTLCSMQCPMSNVVPCPTSNSKSREFPKSRPCAGNSNLARTRSSRHPSKRHSPGLTESQYAPRDQRIETDGIPTRPPDLLD